MIKKNSALISTCGVLCVAICDKIRASTKTRVEATEGLFFIKVVLQATANAFIAIHILMPYNIILYFRLLYFHVSICALFST